MASEVSVCNEALVLIGQDIITSISPPDANTRARVCAQFFDQARDFVLREFDWNFASIRVSLGAPLTSTPAFGFTKSFTLPSDPFCLRVLETNHPDTTRWRVEGRTLSMSVDAVSIRYTGRILDTSLWSADFVEVLSLYLSSKIAYPLTKTRGVAKDQWALYLNRRHDMWSPDSQEGSPPPRKPTSLEAVR